MSSDLPEPPVPADADLRDFVYMPLDVVRLRDSDLAGLEDAEARWAAVISWCVAWHQVPAGSLPDDDAILAKLLGYGRDKTTWLRARAGGALRGYVKCSDGRLYHPVVCEKALTTLAKKAKQRNQTEAARKARIAALFSKQKSATVDVTETATSSATESKGREGKGREREGRGGVGERENPAPAADSDAGASAPPPLLLEPPRETFTPTQATAVWNEEVGATLGKVRALTPERERKLRTLLASKLFVRDPREAWARYLRKIRASAFLRGEGEGAWRASFDWALKVSNAVKVAEGNYDDRHAAPDDRPNYRSAM